MRSLSRFAGRLERGQAADPIRRRRSARKYFAAIGLCTEAA
jgi:hypothetical protein